MWIGVGSVIAPLFIASLFVGNERHKNGNKVGKDKSKETYCIDSTVSYNNLSITELGNMAKNGDPIAQCIVGLRYVSGDDFTERNKKLALAYIRNSAESGYVPAVYFLGEFYEHGFAVPENREKALNLYRRAAEQNYPEAQFKLGKAYLDGWITTENEEDKLKKSFYWYKKAAGLGLAKAQYEVGKCFATGQGVQEDTASAIVYFEEAAKKHLPIAEYTLGMCYNQGLGVPLDKQKMLYWLNRAAMGKYPKAECELGNCYAYGNGVTPSLSEALKYWKEASEHGDLDARYLHGLNSYLSLQSPPDKASGSRSEIESAAEKGQFDALKFLRNEIKVDEVVQSLGYIDTPENNLHIAVLTGIYDKPGKLYLEKSAQQGHPVAQFLYGISMFGESQNLAISNLIKSAEHGNMYAQYTLAIYYALGIGVVQNMEISNKWMERSANSGSYIAKQVLNNVNMKQLVDGARKEDRNAMFELAELIEDIRPSESEKLYLNAARLGHPKAMIYCVCASLVKEKERLSFIQKSAAAGFPIALYLMSSVKHESAFEHIDNATRTPFPDVKETSLAHNDEMERNFLIQLANRIVEESIHNDNLEMLYGFTFPDERMLRGVSMSFTKLSGVSISFKQERAIIGNYLMSKYNKLAAEGDLHAIKWHASRNHFGFPKREQLITEYIAIRWAMKAASLGDVSSYFTLIVNYGLCPKGVYFGY